MKSKLIILILIAGLLAACATQATEAPASPPTEEPALPTETNPPPTDTAVPTDTALPTNTAAPTLEPTSAATTAPSGAVTVSFATDIQPLLKSRCGNCHGGSKKENGLSLLSYAEIMTGSESGAVVIPGDAAKSLLVEMVASLEMPKRGPKLTPPQVQLIIDWINQGALDN